MGRLLMHTAAPPAGMQVSLATCSTSGLPSWLQLSLDGGELAVHRCSSRGQPGPPPAPGYRLIPPAGDAGGEGSSGGSGGAGSSGGGGSGASAADALASLARHLGVAPARLQLDSVRYRRVRLPLPADLQAVAGEPEGMALLRRCQVGGLPGGQLECAADCAAGCRLCRQHPASPTHWPWLPAHFVPPALRPPAGPVHRLLWPPRPGGAAAGGQRGGGGCAAAVPNRWATPAGAEAAGRPKRAGAQVGVGEACDRGACRARLLAGLVSAAAPLPQVRTSSVA